MAVARQRLSNVDDGLALMRSVRRRRCSRAAGCPPCVPALRHSSTPTRPEKVENPVKRTFQPNTRRRARKHGFAPACAPVPVGRSSRPGASRAAPGSRLDLADPRTPGVPDAGTFGRRSDRDPVVHLPQRSRRVPLRSPSRSAARRAGGRAQPSAPSLRAISPRCRGSGHCVTGGCSSAPAPAHEHTFDSAAAR